MTAAETMRGAMPLKAFGAYIKRLRERKQLSQVDLANQLDGAVGLRTIGRWENGRNEPYNSELLPVLDYLGGSIVRAVLLMMSTTATEEDGKRMAEMADNELTPDEMAFFTSLSPKQRRLLRQFIESEGED